MHFLEAALFSDPGGFGGPVDFFGKNANLINPRRCSTQRRVSPMSFRSGARGKKHAGGCRVQAPGAKNPGKEAVGEEEIFTPITSAAGVGEDFIIELSNSIEFSVFHRARNFQDSRQIRHLSFLSPSTSLSLSPPGFFLTFR